MRVRLAIALGAVALLSTACPASTSDGVGANATERTLPPPTGSDTEDDTGSAAPRIVDSECYHDEAICGTVLAPQVPGSPDLVEIGFRLITSGGSGIPIVLLEQGDDPIELRPDDFPDRTLLSVGSRGSWPGGPLISCPEWNHLSFDPGYPALASAAANCADRLTATGIALEGGSRANQAADVIAVLTALGIEEFDVIASGVRTDHVGVIADSPLTVRRAVYVQPLLSGWDPVVARSAGALAALGAVWTRCGEVQTCSTVGTVEDFLAAIEALENDPVDNAHSFGDPIDADLLGAAVFREIDEAAGAAFLPELHKLIIERDSESLSSYVNSSFGSTNVNGLAIACGRFTSVLADYGGFPSLVRQRSAEANDFFSASCPEWGGSAPEEPRVPPPGIFVTTLALVDPTGEMPGVGPIVREPTVGPPTSDCIITVAIAWLDEERIDDLMCSTPLNMGGREGLFEMIDGRYVYDDGLTVRTQIPNTWTELGTGTWYREADPLDTTNLDVYVWTADDAQIAQSEMVSEWNLLDPSYDTRSVGTRAWLLAHGEDGWGNGTFSVAIAVTRIADVTVGMVLSADTAELDDLIETILIPALEGTALET